MEQLSLIKHYTSIFIEEQVLLGNVYFCVLDASRTNIVYSVLLWLQNTNATTGKDISIQLWLHQFFLLLNRICGWYDKSSQRPLYKFDDCISWHLEWVTIEISPWTQDYHGNDMQNLSAVFHVTGLGLQRYLLRFFWWIGLVLAFKNFQCHFIHLPQTVKL